MPRLGTRLQVVLAAISLWGAAAVPVSAQVNQTTTVVRTSGSMVTANLTTYGDCIQRYFDISAESSVEKTRVDGTRSVGETVRTMLSLVESDVCVGSQMRLSVEWPNLDGVSWDTALGTASMNLSRPVDVLRCTLGDGDFLCETHSELLTLNVKWIANGDFNDTVYVSRQTIDGTFRTERSRGKTLSMEVIPSMQLDGAALSFSSGYGNLLKSRRGTLTIGSL